MKIRHHASSPATAAFTLAEMLIVITIIGLLAAMTMQGYTYAMRSSKRRVTEASMTAIQSSLERYNDKYGEYPEPASPSETMQITPNHIYNVAGSRCLYQALTGDGHDAIKGGENGGGENGASDGDFQDDEIQAVLFKDMPPAMKRVVSKMYLIVDGFSIPFQYMKATTDTTAEPVTVNPTYDIWSYGEDVEHTSSSSTDAQEKPAIAQKWIKNW